MSTNDAPASTARANEASFAREALGLGIAWLALLGLLACSLGAAYLRLGIGNVVAGLGIAALKTAIVGWWFMRVRTASAAVRAAAIAAGLLLAILFTLAGTDYLTRLAEPAAVQVPRQIEPLLATPQRR